MKQIPIKRFRVSIYGILRDSEGRVLVTESTGHSGTFMNFPGGGIDLGESPMEALHREMGEEVGLVVKPVRLLYTSLGFHRGVIKPKRQMIGIYWLVDKVSGELREGNGLDVVGVHWVAPADLEAAAFTTFDREALPAIIAALT